MRTKEDSFYNILLNTVLNIDNYFYYNQYLIKEYSELYDFTKMNQKILKIISIFSYLNK